MLTAQLCPLKPPSHRHEYSEIPRASWHVPWTQGADLRTQVVTISEWGSSDATCCARAVRCGQR